MAARYEQHFCCATAMKHTIQMRQAGFSKLDFVASFADLVLMPRLADLNKERPFVNASLRAVKVKPPKP